MLQVEIPILESSRAGLPNEPAIGDHRDKCDMQHKFLHLTAILLPVMGSLNLGFEIVISI